MLFTVSALLVGLASPALTSPLQFPGAAPLVPADTRVPNPCTTLDGTMCVFPFTYQVPAQANLLQIIHFYIALYNASGQK